MKIDNLVSTRICLKRGSFSLVESFFLEIRECEPVISVAITRRSAGSAIENGPGIAESFLRRVDFCEIERDIHRITQLHRTLERSFSTIEVTQFAVTVAKVI